MRKDNKLRPAGVGSRRTGFTNPGSTLAVFVGKTVGYGLPAPASWVKSARFGKFSPIEPGLEMPDGSRLRLTVLLLPGLQCTFCPTSVRRLS